MTALVDYSSSSDDALSPPRKKTKTSLSHPPPPLPSAFHDLYASTVRTAPTDDPALHHGRTRQTPHVAGHWPSHISIEWIPTPAEHNLLAELLDDLSAPRPMRPSSSISNVNAAAPSKTSPIHSLLTSELGVSLPMHISLSRPFVLLNANKDAFLADARRALAGPVRAFTAEVYGLAWHQSPDSHRAFLVLRVKAEGSRDGDDSERKDPFMELLRRCNALVRDVGQPELYTGTEDNAEGAFHVSIAWASGVGGGKARTDEEVAARERETRRVWEKGGFGEKLKGLGIEVESVKCKIGNVVTNLPLAGGAAERRGGGSLLGV